MKARDLKKMGYDLFIDAKGRAVWVKALVKITEDTAPEVSLAQLAEIERRAAAAVTAPPAA